METPPTLIVPDAPAWRAWLTEHGEQAEAGVWLVLAKKGTTDPTTLTYAQALDEALCFGWIDGQVKRRDEATFQQRFTARRAKSPWSKRNVAHVERLAAAGRMTEPGLRQVALARADGRFAAAYAGAAAKELPDDLAAALAANPDAQRMWDVLTSQNRYAITYRLSTAKQPATRQRNLERFVAMLAAGETLHPQKRTRPPA